MKMEITRVTTSKKGVVWIQAKILCDMQDGDFKAGDTFKCVQTDLEKSQHPDKKENSEKEQ
jgi:hypothetical protein